MRLLRTTLLAALVLLLVAACDPTGWGGGGTGGGMQTFASGPDQPVVPNGVLLGLSSYPPGYGTIAQRNANWSARNSQIGRPYDVANFFYRWDLPFPTAEQTNAIANGTTPMISWNGTDTDVITSGQVDDLIRTRARGLKALGVPVFLRFFWEMDGKKGTDLAHGDPVRFVAAWRYVHALFDAEGVTNVSWVWAPTNLRFGGTDPAAPRWYPGDDVVDWIGVDGYNWSPVYGGYPYDQFQSIFADWYAWAAPRNKPLMVAETGALERNTGEKADWFGQMATTLKTSYQNIRAVIYYDITDDATLPFRWKVDTSPESLDAWKTMAADPYFNTRAPAPSPPRST